MKRVTVIDAIATGNPPLRRSQDFAAAFMDRVEGIPESVRSRIPQLYAQSGIEYRFSCVEDYVREAEDFTFYPKTWTLEPPPSTEKRNALYRESVVPLAEDVARRVIESSTVSPDEITHVIVVSCTGFFAPGLDVELVRRLGMRPEVQRTLIGFMGCYAAFNALRVANGFCRADPDARVLVVCAELCTLHFNVSRDLESAVINGLFSDGAAAVVLRSASSDEAEGELCYTNSLTRLDDNSLDHMTWDIGDTGFRMGLSARVPAVLARQLPRFVDDLIGSAGLQRKDIDFWAIHPGGRAIIDRACDCLELSEEQTEDSREVLRLHGNMSSPTILFVLKRILDRHRRLRSEGEPGLAHGIAMAFGPGLTLEGTLVQRGDLIHSRP